MNNTVIEKEKFTDKKTALEMVQIMEVPNPDPKVQKIYDDAKIKKFDKIKIIEVPEYDCMKGPNSWMQNKPANKLY